MQEKKDRLSQAAAGGSLEMVNWLMFTAPLQFRQAATQNTVNKAARSGRLELIQWLLCACRQSEKQTPNQETFNQAARSGNVEMLQWLWGLGQQNPLFRITAKTVNLAARSGSVEALSWLIVTRKRPCISQKTWISGCRSGSEAMLRYLEKTHGHVRQGIDRDELMAAAIDSGNFHCVQWVRGVVFHGE